MRKKARKPKGKRPTGRVPGVPVETTPASARANAVRAWKNGSRAKTVTALEVMQTRLRKVHPDAPEIVEGFQRALADGDMDAIAPLAVQGMAETEILRRQSFDSIQQDGVVLNEAIVTADGKLVGEKKRDHPLLWHMHKFNETLGFTAPDLLLSKKSRGEGARDEAIAAALRRDDLLRSADKSGMATPPARKLLTP